MTETETPFCLDLSRIYIRQFDCFSNTVSVKLNSVNTISVKLMTEMVDWNEVNNFLFSFQFDLSVIKLHEKNVSSWWWDSFLFSARDKKSKQTNIK